MLWYGAGRAFWFAYSVKIAVGIVKAGALCGILLVVANHAPQPPWQALLARPVLSVFVHIRPGGETVNPDAKKTGQ